MEKEKTNHVRLRDRTSENDIKYSGPLSYRHLRIIGWVLLALSQIAIILNLNMKINPGSEYIYQGWINVFKFFSNFPLPLFMLANFAAIFQKKHDFKKLLIFYGGMSLGMYALGNFVVMFYGIRFTNALFDGAMDFWTSSKVFATIMVNSGSSGFMFNIFIDLFLCVLCFFFMNYKPKKFFQGKKIIFFRLLIILPILYEVGSIIIKHYAVNEYMSITHFVFFLLTSKPPVIFLAFVAITLFMRGFELLHLKKHNDHEKLKEHLGTNAFSLRTSIIIAIIFFCAFILDVVLLISISMIYASTTNTFTQEGFTVALQMFSGIGFGSSASLCLIVPIIFLFSFTKTHKDSMVDLIVPAAGVGLIVLIYVEGLYEIVVNNLPRLIASIEEFFNSTGGGGEEPAPAQAVKNIINLLRK